MALDECTVVSLVPFPLFESKPGLYPGEYRIPSAGKDDIELLVVSRAVHYVYLDMDRGSLAVPTVSEEVARSIVADYIGAQLGYSAGEAEPGLFWVPGAYKDKKALLAVHKDKVDAARVKQRNWFERLVAIADDEWNKYHSHKSISDLQRYAASYLNLEREWNIQGTVASITNCKACKSPIPVDALVCPQCRTVQNPEEYKKRGFQTVG